MGQEESSAKTVALKQPPVIEIRIYKGVHKADQFVEGHIYLSIRQEFPVHSLWMAL